MKKKMIGLTAASLLLSAAILGGCAAGTGVQNVSAGNTASADAALFGTITAEGEGKVSAVPDIAQLDLSVTTQGADAKTAKDENAKQYNQVLEFLKSEGIAESSIQTENVYLNPIYDWSGNTQTITGYSMATDMTVSDISIDRLSELLDKAVDAGINGIQSVTYMCSSYDEKYNEALQLAVENAKSKADAIAAAGGTSAGTMQNVSEYGADTTARYTNAPGARSMAVDESTSASDMAVMPGELEITARVSASFEIQK